MPDDAPPEKVDRRRGPRPAGFVVGKPWPKGKSQNPGGIPSPKSIGKRKRAHMKAVLGAAIEVTQIGLEESIIAAGPAAVQLMVDVMADKGEQTRDRLYAARTIIDKLKPNAVATSAKEDDEVKKKAALEEFAEVMKAKAPHGGEGEGVT